MLDTTPSLALFQTAAELYGTPPCRMVPYLFGGAEPREGQDVACAAEVRPLLVRPARNGGGGLRLHTWQGRAGRPGCEVTT